MNRPPVFSTVIFVLALTAAAMACSIGAVGETVREAYKEKCYKVDRAEYERAAAELGQAPKTPNYPELVTYEVCYRNDGDDLSSVRMSEGYRPEESEPATSQPADVKPTKDLAPPDSQATSQPADVKPTKDVAPPNSPARTIPAGTYRGQIPWNASATTSKLVENEITIVVSSSGQVSGEARWKYNRTDLTNKSGGGKCTSSLEFLQTYTLSGQVAGVDERSITVEVDLFEFRDLSNCGRESRRREESWTCPAIISHHDGTLTVTCGRVTSGGGAYLTAKK